MVPTLIRRRRLLTLVGALGVFLALLVPLAASGAKKPSKPQRAAVENCTSLAVPFPLELNTAVSGSLVKTVAMEKEVFDCTDPQAPSPTHVIRDVEIFVELLETESATTVATTRRFVTVATCNKKLFPEGTVVCRSANIPLLAPPAKPLDQCFPAQQQPADAVEMNTVPVGTNWIKTIKVEKEIFGCNDGTTIGDLFLFTEILEKRTPIPTGGETFATSAVRFDAVMCKKNPHTGAVIGCTRVNTA